MGIKQEELADFWSELSDDNGVVGSWAVLSTVVAHIQIPTMAARNKKPGLG